MRVLRRAVRLLTAVSLVAIAGLAILLGCLWAGNRRTTILPMPTGPFAVGRVTYDWRDPNQQELMAPQPGIPREVFAWVWYPATPQGSRQTADYFPKSWRDALSRQRGWFLTHFLWRDFARVQTHSVAEAEVAAAQPKYPVLLMRAGAAAEVAAYTSLAEDLASHGYVVVGFDAPYRSTLAVFPDGRIIARTPENNADLVSGEQQEQLGNRLVQAWSADLSFALDRLAALDASDATGRFKGRLDLTRVGVFGHSLGGATAMQFCHDDVRCKAGVDIDGAPLGSVVSEGMKQPLLFVESDHHRESKAETESVEADVRSIYGRLPEDKRLWIVIRGAGHYGFADLAPAPVQVMHWLRIFPVDGQRQIVMTRDYLCRFFDVWLKGAPASALQSVQKYPEIETGH